MKPWYTDLHSWLRGVCLVASWYRLAAIVRKELLHIVRDPRNLFLVAVSPAFLLFLLAYIFSFEITQQQLAVMDLDHTSLSRRYLAGLTNDRDFVLARTVAGYDEIDPLLVSGAIDAAIVIPPGFADTIRRGQPAQVQVILDGSDPFSASQVMSSLSARSAAFVVQAGPALSREPIELRTQGWYNVGFKSLVSMVPGLLAVVLIMPTLALALALAREKESGTLEGLVATPISGLEYLMGKLVAYIGMGLLSAMLAFLVAVVWFQVPFRGSWPVYLLVTADYFLACMGAAVLIGNFVKSQQTALFIVLLIFLVPSFFLAGLITPVSTGSLGARIASFLLPSTHLVQISRTLFLKGLGLGTLWRPALALFGMGLGAVVTGLILFRKKVG